MFFFIVLSLSRILFGAGIKSGRATRKEEGNYHKTATTKAFAENLRKMRVRVIYAWCATYPACVGRGKKVATEAWNAAVVLFLGLGHRAAGLAHLAFTRLSFLEQITHFVKLFVVKYYNK